MLGSREFVTFARKMAEQAKLSIEFGGLLEAVQKMKANKATGLDGVSNEMVSFVTWNALIVLHRLFEERLNSTQPDTVVDWQTIIVHCIPKKPSPTSLSQWRPISLLPTIEKLFAATLTQNIVQYVPWPQEVYGFIEGKQTMEVTAAHRMALNKSLLWSTPLLYPTKLVFEKLLIP